MNGYEKLIKIMRNTGSTSNNVFLVTMESSNSCYLNNLKLEKDDLFISQHLVTGWYIDPETFIKPLEKGDMVILMKLDETKYVVIGRVV
ncbi:hypothetical protein EDD66_105302 [Mobilisporobacter senegalensis]|uniref:DUF2577 domain-containing protein n=1 Tax=Mobilisporobacter senegalensis TaxID=1329262 RepID=A0A3N1XNU1_9FIRM|nr:hypothetical protein [Mobilisporobacter senegalensis]ROR28360.1 hypothetical protein EDD66_105302 [Mobilisporobacter senegalensis]